VSPQAIAAYCRRLIQNPAEKRDAIEGALDHKDVDAERNIEHELEENSPYPEVRAAVRATDEDVPANTLRAWILGMIFVTIGSGCNMLFSLRNPAIQITSIVAQLVSYPFGLMMAAWLPTRKFKTFGVTWSFNPGPFNIKEHALVTIMSNVSFAQGAAYSTYSLESLIAFYKVDYGWGFALLFVSYRRAKTLQQLMLTVQDHHDAVGWSRSGRHFPTIPRLPCCHDLAHHPTELCFVLFSPR
jgi:hypothetical protein